MNVNSPQGIYYKEIGCTIYPSIFDFPVNMQQTLQKSCSILSRNLIRVGLSHKNNDDYIQIIQDIHRSLALHGIQILNIHNATTQSPLKNNEPGYNALQCMLAQIRFIASVKLAIELGADVNGITSGSTLLCSMLLVEKTSPLWIATTMAKVYKKEKECFDIVLYLRSRGGIMYSSCYQADDEQNFILRKIDEILIKRVLVLRGHYDTTSSLSLLHKEIIMFISKLFVDCIHKEIQ